MLHAFSNLAHCGLCYPLDRNFIITFNNPFMFFLDFEVDMNRPGAQLAKHATHITKVCPLAR